MNLRDGLNQTVYPVIVIKDKEYLQICKSEELFEKKGIRIKFDDDEDRQVAVFRVHGKLYCLWNVCPHRHNAQIHNGIIRDGTVICPVHAWTYDLQSGRNINQNQGLKSLMTFHIFEEDGFVYIEKPNINIPKWRSEN